MNMKKYKKLLSFVLTVILLTTYSNEYTALLLTKMGIVSNEVVNAQDIKESEEDVNLIFADDCYSLKDSAWIKSQFTNKCFIADNSDSKKYNKVIEENEYLFFGSEANKLAFISKEVKIGGGAFNLNFNSKIKSLQTPSANAEWRGFVAEINAANQRYRMSFNSKNSKGEMKVRMLTTSGKNTTYVEQNVNAPSDNNYHKWSIGYDGKNDVFLFLDNEKVATFSNIQLSAGNSKDKIIFYSDTNNLKSGYNEVYINDISIEKPLSIKEINVLPAPNKKSLDIVPHCAIKDFNLLKNSDYKIKVNLYKDGASIAELTQPLKDNDTAFNFANLKKSGTLKVSVKLLQNNKILEEKNKTVKVYEDLVNISAKNSITSQGGTVYYFDEFDKIGKDNGDGTYKQLNKDEFYKYYGWNLLKYNYPGTEKEKTMIANNNDNNNNNNDDAKPIKLPFKLNGWFRVYIGYNNQSDAIEVKKEKEENYTTVWNNQFDCNSANSNNNFLVEKPAFISNFKDESLTISTGYYQNATIAYVKFEGLTKEQIELWNKKDEGENGKRIIYDFDGYSDLFSGKLSNYDCFKNSFVDPLKEKNVGEINWTLGTTGMLNYNSKYAGKAFSNWDKYSNQLRNGDKKAKENLYNILSSDKSPLEIFADETEKVNMKTNASLRMNVFYNPTIYGFFNGEVYDKYIDCRQKESFLMSYYYPKFRTYVKNVLKEASSFKYVDGVTLDFCRYPNVMGREAKQDEKVKIMNQFMRELRKEIPKDKTITVKFPYDNPISYGLDVKTWVKDGVVDRIVPANIAKEDFFDITSYINIVKGTKVQLYIGIVADVSGKDLTKKDEEDSEDEIAIVDKTYLTPHEYMLRAYEVYKAGADGIFLFNTPETLLMNTQSLDETRFLSDKIKMEKWHEFEYNQNVLYNRINIME